MADDEKNEEEKVEPNLEDSPDEGDEDDSGGGKKKLILFIVAPILILAGAGGGLYFSGALDSLLGGKEEVVEEEEAPKKEEGGEEEAEVKSDPMFLEIPDMRVTLNNEQSAQPRFLQLTIQLELKNQADLDAVQKVLPRVIDQFQTYLRELRIRDLRGSAGLYRMQIELLARVNAAAYPVEVQDVLFQEILIQ